MLQVKIKSYTIKILEIGTLEILTEMILKFEYRNFPKFLDRQVWANSADPDQTILEWLQQIFWVSKNLGNLQ